MNKKKLRKFLRDPKLFFSDMWVKRVSQLRARGPKRMRGNYKYSVVSAVYNVEKYLNDFFVSLIEQRLDFRENIQVVMVDDGSQDKSTQIIKKWAKRYPKNIFYVKKDNGGQASARNLGLAFAKGDFVTFIDPDDFVDPSYFVSVDSAIKDLYTPSTAYVATRLVMYLEQSRTYRQHPLNSKFSKKTEKISLEHKSNIQLSSASAFFRLDDIKASKDLQFPEDVKPSWEDAYFINNLAIALGKDNAILVPEAQYFYRRRADGTSTVDRTWDTADKYSTVFQNGYIRVLERARAAYGSVPQSIQRLVMYDVAWYIKRFVWNPREYVRLPDEWKASLKEGMRSIFEHIDKKTIEEFHTAGFWYMYKKGILDYYGKGEASNPHGYVRSIDPARKLIEVVVYESTGVSVSVSLDGIDRLPSYHKRRNITFLGEKFVDERIIWIPFDSASQKLALSLAGRELPLVFMQNAREQVRSIADVIKFYKKGISYPKRKASAWMFMDRDVRADDNAEHFYRYVMRNSPEREIYFALNRTSSDWERLEQEGFNLVDFSSDQFGRILSRCEKFLSSHNYRRLVASVRADIMDNIDFVFLQHGVTQNDVSTAFNSIKIDMFVAASEAEARGIAQDGNGFKLSRREVFASGFPRHDALVSGGSECRDYIVVMPTWREYLSGDYAGAGMSRQTNRAFFESEYLRQWSAVLRSPALKELAMRTGHKVVFIPHPEISNYLDAFGIPEYVHIVDGDISIQSILRQTALYITDYSSVAFDVAYLERPCIYFQFDEDEFYSRHYLKGYFNYRAHGFGPVVTTLQELVDVTRCLLKDGDLSGAWQARRQAFFPVRDGKNCERLIAELVRRETVSNSAGAFRDLSVSRLFAHEAMSAGQWSLAEDRWREILLRQGGVDDDDAKICLSRALYKQGRFVKAANTLASADSSKPGVSEQAAREHARLLIAQGAWGKAERLLVQLEDSNRWASEKLLICCASLGNEMATRELVSSAVREKADGQEIRLSDAWVAYAARDWRLMLELTDSPDPLNSDPDWYLRRARAYRSLGSLSKAHAELVSYESFGSCTAWRVEVAMLAFAREDWQKAVSQLELAFPEGPATMPAEALAAWLCCARHLGRSEDALEIAIQVLPVEADLDIVVQAAELASAAKNFSLAIDLWTRVLGSCEFAPYRLAAILLESGAAKRALDVLSALHVREPKTIEEWALLADVYYLNQKFELATDALNRTVQFYGGKTIPAWILERLELATLMQRTRSICSSPLAETLKNVA